VPYEGGAEGQTRCEDGPDAPLSYAGPPIGGLPYEGGGCVVYAEGTAVPYEGGAGAPYEGGAGVPYAGVP
jgi:hypothetical protein